MKEDILEQLVDDYLQWKGYFTRHNLKFKPRPDHPEYDSQADCVASDIDVLGFHPGETGTRRVMAVSCKAWQGGFRIADLLGAIRDNKKRSGRETWKGFRELVVPKWSAAFVSEVEKVAGSRQFTYVTAVTSLRGDRDDWAKHPPFSDAIGGNPIEVWTFGDLLGQMYPEIGTSVAGSQLGRVLQLMKASGWSPAGSGTR